MKKKLTILATAVAFMCSGVALAGPCGPRGGGFHHGGGFRGGVRCAPVHHGGFHHSGFRGGYHGGWGGYRGGYYGGHRHHWHGYRGLGLAAGIVGLAGVTSAIVSDWVNPPVVVAPSVYPASVYPTSAYVAPTAYAAPAYVAPTTYAAPVAVPAPVVTTTAPVVYRY